LRFGQRILGLGSSLPPGETASRILKNFQVIRMGDDSGQSANGEAPPRANVGRGRPGSLVGTAEPGDPGLRQAFFDAVLAIDYWPARSLAATSDRWRRLLVPQGGVAIVGGTGVPTDAGHGQAAAERWAGALTEAGFSAEVVFDCPAPLGRYADIAGTARIASDSLRAALGAELANSYLAHVDRLDQITSREPARRFGVIARLPSASN
jgi:hypothetical protein